MAPLHETTLNDLLKVLNKFNKQLQTKTISDEILLDQIATFEELTNEFQNFVDSNRS